MSPPIASVEADARRCAGTSFNSTSNSLRVGSMCSRAVTVNASEAASTRNSAAPSPSSANTRMASAAAASGMPASTPCSFAPSRDDPAAGRGPVSGPTVATVDPSAIPVSSSAASSSAPVRVRARAAATAAETHGPGLRAAPSSSATIPASTIVMPAPPYASGISKPVAPSPASPRHTSSVVPVCSSSNGRTYAATLAFSITKRWTVSRRATCSSVSSRFIAGATPGPGWP